VTPYERALRGLLRSPTRPKLGLERMAALLARLGDPERRAPALHVAGTKGKGSTCAFAEAMCRAAGLRTGLTTSPHLSSARERIQLEGEPIGEAGFAALAEEVEEAAAALVRLAPRDRRADLEASFFEKMIAMAFVAFARARVDVAIFEVGLGGRLDATNLCLPVACAVTRLGLDHTEHLGPTLGHIAREKAGIFKEGVPAVTAPQPPEAMAVLVEEAARRGVPLAVVRPDPTLRPALAGAHQHENASVAAALVRVLFARWGRSLDEEALARGAASVRWPGRYEALRDDPPLIIDGAHNETAGEALAATASSDPRLAPGFTLIVGMTAGHDPLSFARALAPLGPARVLAVPTRSPRSQSAADVGRAFARVFGHAESCALEEALARSRSEPTLLTGSLHLVGEARSLVLGVPTDPDFPLF
jgi:dihydrofolate synthase / folylpolyglutamate synthase